MPCAIGIREVVSRKVLLFWGDIKIDPDDPLYEEDVHFVPCTEVNGMYEFGAHDFARSCYCRPEVRPKVNGRYMVMHKDTVN